MCDLEGRILYESLVRPTASVPKAAARIHWLTMESLTPAPMWDTMWQRLEPIVVGRVLIAYNAGFDRRMVDLECARYRFPTPQVRWRCALRFSKERAGFRRAPTLTEACQHYGITPGTHRALSDAQATAALLRHLISRKK